MMITVDTNVLNMLPVGARIIDVRQVQHPFNNKQCNALIVEFIDPDWHDMRISAFDISNGHYLGESTRQSQ